MGDEISDYNLKIRRMIKLMRKKFPQNGVMILLDKEFTSILELDSSLIFVLSRPYMNENKVTLRTKDYQKIKDLAQLRMKDPKYIAEAKALAKERGISISVETIFNEVMTLGDSLSDEEKKVILEIIASMAP